VAVHIEQNCNASDIISEQENLQVAVSGEEVKERACDSLVMCIVTTLNQGLRNGGGIGDILRAPSSTVSYCYEHKVNKVNTAVAVLISIWPRC
jgi:hypothetical protein